MGKPIYKLIGEEIIEEMMLAGIAVLVLAFGINYFNLKQAWGEAFSAISTATNLNFVEAGLIFNAISNTFPFSILAGDFDNFSIALLIGLSLTLVGFVLKVMTTKTKEKFIEDLGRELYIPAVVGFLGVVFLHLVTAFLLQDQVSNALNMMAKFNSGVLVWRSFGSTLLAGLSALVMGALITIVAKAKKFDKFIILGKTMVNGGYTLIVYFILIRILAFDIILSSPYGAFLKVFIVSGDISNGVIIFTVFMFWFGKELRRYGRYLRVKKKWKHMHHSTQPLKVYNRPRKGLY